MLHRIAFPVVSEWCQTVSVIRALPRFLTGLSDPRQPKTADAKLQLAKKRPKSFPAVLVEASAQSYPLASGDSDGDNLI